MPLLDVDVGHLPDCPRAWDMMSAGVTKGVFQLESRLGATWSKRLRPRNFEHLSALGALLRPGCLMAKDEQGVSMTEHYCRRVNREEPASSFHPALDEILSPTEQIMIYQEQAMQIGAKIAGFDLKNVDRLRKAIGKKDQKEMSEVRKLFLEGASQQKVVPDTLAAEIWGWIEKSGRYSFNRCLHPDSMVNTPTGPKRIDDVIVGDRVLSEEGYATVLDKIETGEQEVFEITTESGKKLECTLDHKIVCEDGIKRPLREIIEKSYRIVCA